MTSPAGLDLLQFTERRAFQFRLAALLADALFP